MCFQRQYREFWMEPGREGTFSRVMTPSVVLQRETHGNDQGHLIIFDAKHRVDTDVNEALNSIHTCRDAPMREAEVCKPEGIVSSAFLHIPHLPILKGGYRQTPIPGRLFHPDCCSKCRFSALTMKPSKPPSTVSEALQAIVADAFGVLA